MEQFHGTTILSVRRDGMRWRWAATGRSRSATSSMKATARKVRRLYHDRVLAGFAGATADAFTLFERFEAKLEKHQGHLTRSAVELAKDWRSDRVLRRLEAMLAVADASASLVITGTGDVLEPEFGIVAIGSGGPYAQAAARALLEHSVLNGHARSSSSPWSSRATFASTRTSTTSSKRCRQGANGREERYDVIVAGAGLVGMALATALARSGLTVALVDRKQVAAPEFDPQTWDARVYAISPGQRHIPARARGLADAARGAHHADRGDARHGRRWLDGRILRLRIGGARAGLDRRGARVACSIAAACLRCRRRSRRGCAVRIARVVGGAKER